MHVRVYGTYSLDKPVEERVYRLCWLDPNDVEVYQARESKDHEEYTTWPKLKNLLYSGFKLHRGRIPIEVVQNCHLF